MPRLKVFRPRQKKIEAQPNISAEQITAFANLILEKRGYDYSFDVCEFLTFTKSNAISKRDEAYGTFLYRAPFFQMDGEKLTVQFSSGEAAPCGECFTEFPVHKLSATEIHTLVGGKMYHFKRPKQFVLDKMDLMDATMKKVIRSWEIPVQSFPTAISEDGKTLYLGTDFTEADAAAGRWHLWKEGEKPKQEYPSALLAFSSEGMRFVVAKPILARQKSEEIKKHPKDPKNDYLMFRRFRVATKSYIIRYSAPCT